ncbi:MULTISPECIES: hypothetical protein [unclassified Streptomyces]|uniref:hypothetical protein n=1 Tax=unclassified Streptomyces TaxID=2593676 RepID=UPI002255CD19|nr:MULTISPECIES: hypothetical protein [unclassified Streptomyces]MCX4526353.1 hypothetical protein [Streptomyces sp. NBC_01551]MCX4543085.1 hypothetical protein [Streptomyces sp. NBC_01565]
MPDGTGNETRNSEIRTAAIGQRFVDALNEGLARSMALRARTRPGRPSGGGELPDPYAAAVLRRFAACLPAALARQGRDDAAARSAAVRRARELLTEAFGLVAPERGRVPPCGPDAEPPLPGDEFVVALLLECAVLVGLEQGTFEDSRLRPAALLRALGGSVRETSLTGGPVRLQP